MELPLELVLNIRKITLVRSAVRFVRISYAELTNETTAWYGAIPGLKVVSPYSAEDCRGLLKVC